MTSPLEFDREHELALVRAAIAGEEKAIQELSDRLRCVPRILSAQNARSGRPLDTHDLADLVQDAIVVILEKLTEYEGRAPLEGWMYRVCCLEFMNGVRRKRRVQIRVGSDSDRVERAVSEADGSVDRAALLHAIERVGGVEAEAVALKHFEGLTFEEMSQRLELPTSTLKTRYYKGLARLEALLSDTEGDDGP